MESVLNSGLTAKVRVLLLGLFSHIFVFSCFGENFQDAFLQALQNDPALTDSLGSVITIARQNRTQMTVDLNGPLVRQLFYQTGLAQQTNGFPPGSNQVARLPHHFMLIGIEEGESEHTRMLEQGLDLGRHGADPHSAEQAPPPFLGVRFQVSATGALSLQMGQGLQRLSTGQTITQDELRTHIQQLNRLSYEGEGFDDVMREMNPNYFETLLSTQARENYARDALDGLSYLKALGINVGEFERLITEFAQSSEAREHFASHIGSYLLNAPHATALARLLREHGLHREAGREIPAPLSDQRLGSEMGDSSQVLQRFNRAEIQQHLDQTDPDTDPHNHRWLQRLMSGNFTDGQLVQHNGLENPFLAYVGTKLKDIPLAVRRQAGLSDDFTLYHRTESTHAADALARGHAFPSLGEGSLFGGSATWGAGLYLGASPHLSHYGPEMVTTRIDPEAVVGQDLDFFVGERDGLIAIIKRDGILSYQRHGPPSFLEMAMDRLADNNPKQAVELLEQRPHLTFAQAQHLVELSFPIRVYLNLRFPTESNAFSETVREGLQHYANSPETMTDSHQDALSEIHRLYPQETLNSVIERVNQHAQNFNQSEERTQFNVVIERAEGAIELAERNTPQIIIDTEFRLLEGRMDHYVQLLQSHLGETPSIAQRLAHLSHFNRAMISLRHRLTDLLTPNRGESTLSTIQRIEAIRDSIWPRVETHIQQMHQAILTEYERNPSNMIQQLAEVALRQDPQRNEQWKELILARENNDAREIGLLIGLLTNLSRASEPEHPLRPANRLEVVRNASNSSQGPMGNLLMDLYTLAAARHYAVEGEGTRPNVPARLREPLARLLISEIPIGTGGRASILVSVHFGDRMSTRVRAEVIRQLNARQSIERRLGLRDGCGFSDLLGQ